jgi:hypothetical protein
VESAVFAITVDTHDFTLDLHSIDAVALGTLLLALATFWLAWKTRSACEGGRRLRAALDELAVVGLLQTIERETVDPAVHTWQHLALISSARREPTSRPRGARRRALPLDNDGAAQALARSAEDFLRVCARVLGAQL